MEIKQYDVFLISLDPTIGHEVKKTRPCIVISPDVMNKNLHTFMIAPMTTQSHSYPTRVSTKFKGKDGFIVLDQIRTVDRARIVKHLGTITHHDVAKIKATLKEILID